LNEGCSGDIIGSSLRAEGSGVFATLSNDVVTIETSVLDGAVIAAVFENGGSGATARIGASRLHGVFSVFNQPGVGLTCAGVYDESFSFYTGPGCP
jgi:hypothetical protein